MKNHLFFSVFSLMFLLVVGCNPDQKGTATPTADVTKTDPNAALAFNESCPCDVRNLPVPLIRLGLQGGLDVTPFPPSSNRKANSAISGAVVLVYNTNKGNSGGDTSAFIGNAISTNDRFRLKNVDWLNETTMVQVNYQVKAGGSTVICPYMASVTDGIVWDDLSLKPNIATATCTDTCSSLAVTSNSTTSHSVEWTPAANGQKIKITIGGVVHVFQFNGTTLVSLGKCQGDNPASLTASSEWQYTAAQFTIKFKKKLGSNSFRFEIVCNSTCSPAACYW